MFFSQTASYAVAGLGIIFVCSGCGTTTTYAYSKPIVAGRKTPPLSNARIAFEGGGWIAVHMTNTLITETQDKLLLVPIPTRQMQMSPFSPYYKTGEAYSTDKPPYFVTEVLITTNEAEVEFSLTHFCIRPPREAACISPTKWLPQTLPIDRANVEFGPLCRNAFNLRQTGEGNGGWVGNFIELKRSEVLRIARQRSACVTLKYPIPPLDPRSEFRIELGSHLIGGQTRTLPTIQYVPGTFTGRVFPGG